MNIDEPLNELGTLDIDALRDIILAQDREAWLEQQHRQDAYEEHRATESIVLIFCDGWPEITVSKEPGWDRLWQQAVPVMTDIIARCYQPGGTIIRAMAANLLPRGRIRPHFDAHPSFRNSHRIHVPITSNRRVRFMIDGRPYRLEVGQAYELNNQKTHSVINNSDEERITFIFDYVPPGLASDAVAAS